VVFQHDGTERHGTVILTETTTTGNKGADTVGDLILNVDEKLVSKDD